MYLSIVELGGLFMVLLYSVWTEQSRNEWSLMLQKDIAIILFSLTFNLFNFFNLYCIFVSMVSLTIGMTVYFINTLFNTFCLFFNVTLLVENHQLDTCKIDFSTNFQF